MTAKCYNCKHVWDYELDNIKIEREHDNSMGYDSIVFKLYCPKCNTFAKDFYIGTLIRAVEPSHVDSHTPSPKEKFTWINT